MTIQEKLEREDILFNLFQNCEITFYELLKQLNELHVDYHKIEL